MKDAFDELRNVLGQLTPGDVSVLRTSISPSCAPMSAYVRLVEPRLIRALLSERDALMADAERYRWLREQHWNDADMAVVCHPRSSVKLGFDCPSRDRLDTAIDAARSKGKEGSE